MNFIQRFIYKQALKALGNNVSLLPSWKRWFPMRSPAFSQLVEEAYMTNPTVYACQLILALTFPEPELWAWQYDETSGEYIKINNHPLRALMAKPHPDMGEAELYKYVITYGPLGGSVFLWKRRDRGGRVMELWPFHRGQMQPIPGRTANEGLVAYYVLDTGEFTEANPFGVERYEANRGIAIPKADIVHWKWMIDPARPWDGLSALVASSGDIDVRNELRTFVYSLLRNDATPPLVVFGAEGDDLSDEKVERLGAQWTQKYGGGNRGRPAFLEYGMDVKQLALTLEQMKVDTLSDGPDAAICMGYHIHPTVVGAMIGLKSSTYNNQSEAREALAVDTNTPLWRSFASEVQQSFADEPGYGRSIRISFDLQMVRALQENQDIVEKRLRSGLDAGALTRAEYRQRLGFQVTDGDDMYKESLAMIWVQRGTVRAPLLPETPTGTQGTPTPETGVDAPPENIGSIVGLSGVQIRAALDILAGVTSGEISTAAAIELLIALGIEEGRAARIVNSTVSGKSITAAGTKMGGLNKRKVDEETFRALQKVVDAQRNIRLMTAGRMSAAVDTFFEKLAVTVVNRGKSRKADDWEVDDFLKEEDGAELERIIKRYMLEVLVASSEIYNVALDASVQFDENDPNVTKILAMAGKDVKDIMETTRQAIAELLKQANENGWSIDQIVRGVDGAPGLRDIVEQTYAGRAKNIARTELGDAQNYGALDRYEKAGASNVLVFDNGLLDDDEPCQAANGAVWTLEQARANRLEHPNCTRAFGALFE